MVDVVKVYQASETVWTLAYVYNSRSGVAEDAGTSITIQINDPEGTEVVASTGMTKYATGQYDHFYTLGATPVSGWYEGTVTVTDGTNVTIKTFGFRVK